MVLVFSLAIWALLLAGSFGLILLYVILIALVLFVLQLVYVVHLRGNAILVGPDQFTDIHSRVVDLSEKAGLRKVPRTYLLQSDGMLNAMATKLFRGQYVVLYTDLLDACGSDTVARDMIIGHEIGHLRSGHLNWFILTAPGRFMPFLGTAYSRACEYTCDRWGAALCGDEAGARRGLLVLAGGRALAPNINVDAYIRQQNDLDTGWMTIARWLSNYPPLSARVDALTAPLGTIHRSARGPLRAVAIMLTIVALAIAVPYGIIQALPHLPALTHLTVGGDPAPDASQAGAETEDLDGLMATCREGDMQACDDLYYAAPVDSEEEEFGNSCGGRVPNNTELCANMNF
ncbi:M48 family metallopeptidase [Aureimonas sp. OT7]|uniref:M48 family metallopeptidase n=1 Tax=Aureimonas sp. OT7 TaxID=2816454 RepID=UPI00177C0476|nr:M48 family metallopeptidase [Aureimonas sp. OT7]QOG05335.1 M48 family metallopeptidase [Aureimonas sp. OT7]